MKNKLLPSILIVFALIVTACGSAMPAASTAVPTLPVSNPPTDTPVPAMPTDTPAPVMPTDTATAAVSSGSPATLMVGQASTLGSFLVDSQGMTLYLFTHDTPNTSNCYGGCATNWPPLLTSGAPTAGDGVDASLLGTTARTDGTTQVTYNGWPLYYYAADHAAGEAKGEGVGGVWYVISPAGTQE